MLLFFFFFQAEDGIRDIGVTGVQTCALPIWRVGRRRPEDPVPPRRDRRARLAKRRTRRAKRATRPGETRNSPGETRNSPGVADRKSVVEGKSGDLGGRRIIKKKKKNNTLKTT